MITNTEFDGNFEFLPVRAHLIYGAVPSNPTYGDFAMAVSDVESNPEDAAAHWRVEAIRERRLHPGASLTTPAINQRTATRLYKATAMGAQRED